MGVASEHRPWGVFLLPRTDKAFVVEYNRQRYIGGPAIWTEGFRVDELPDPAAELVEGARRDDGAAAARDRELGRRVDLVLADPDLADSGAGASVLSPFKSKFGIRISRP